MGYIENNLGLNEEVRIKARFHWGMFIGPAFFLILGIVGILPLLIDDDYGFLAVLGGVIGFFALIRLVRRLIGYFSSEFVATNKRVMGKKGLLGRTSNEIINTQIASIHVKQSLMGRILNYGTLVITSTGGTMLIFAHVHQALAIRAELIAMMPAG